MVPPTGTQTEHGNLSQKRCDLKNVGFGGNHMCVCIHIYIYMRMTNKCIYICVCVFNHTGIYYILHIYKICIHMLHLHTFMQHVCPYIYTYNIYIYIHARLICILTHTI